MSASVASRFFLGMRKGDVDGGTQWRQDDEDDDDDDDDRR